MPTRTASRRFWAELGAQGTLGIHLPEEFGGQGAGMVELAVVAEELGRAAASGPWDTTAVVGRRGGRAGGPILAKECCPAWPTVPCRPRWWCPTGGARRLGRWRRPA